MAIAVATKPKAAVKQVEQVTPLQELKNAVQLETEKRKIIQDFISSQLKEGVDYGTIKINGRASKPTLFKPGMEKIFSLFAIVSELEKDEQTLSMIKASDVIAYKCRLYRNGQFLSEGRGAASVAERGRVNDAIKIAEKRARMDACLNLGFSEYFTQDLEDMRDEKPAEAASPAPARNPLKMETLNFTVDKKEELTSQSGNPYARLSTDKGTVIVFRNSMDLFKEGGTYLAGGMWEERNGNNAFVVTRYNQASA